MPAPTLSPLVVSPVVPEMTSPPKSLREDRPQSSGVVSQILGWIAVALTAVAFTPLLRLHLTTLRAGSEYQHAPLLLTAIALLLWQRWPRKGETRTADAHRPVGMLVGLVGLFAAIVLNSPPLAMLSAVPAIASSLIWISRTAEPRRILAPCLLLLLLVPLPFFMQMELVQTLKGWTTQCASLILDMAGINHQLFGFTLAIPGKWFFVDDACSGVNSLFGMLSLAMVLAVWWRLPLTVTLSMIPATLLGVLAVNVVRVVIIVAAWSWHGIDLSSGRPHELLGLALLPLTLMLVVGLVSWTHWLLAPIGAFGDSPLTELWDRVLHGNDAHEEDHEAEHFAEAHPSMMGLPLSESPQFVRSTLGWLPIAGLAGLAIFGQDRLERTHAAVIRNTRPMELLEADSLPEALDHWKLADFRPVERQNLDPQGQHSRVWRYQHDEADRAMVISVDYTFPGWHELTACYRGSGWQVKERRTSGGQGKPWIVRTVLQDGAGTTAYLWFAIVDPTGKTLEPPQQHWTATLRNQLRIALDQFGTDTTTRQAQLLLPGGREVSSDELLQIEQRFKELIPRLAPNLVAADGAGALRRKDRER